MYSSTSFSSKQLALTGIKCTNVVNLTIITQVGSFLFRVNNNHETKSIIHDSISTLEPSQAVVDLMEPNFRPLLARVSNIQIRIQIFHVSFQTTSKFASDHFTFCCFQDELIKHCYKLHSTSPVSTPSHLVNINDHGNTINYQC